MLSFSDNELAVIGFLTRNFSERLTIRNIAQKLGFSAAGVHNILKKLEKENIVTGQRFGTGLFYSMNFDSKITEHLCTIVLLYTQEKIEKSILDAASKYKAAIYDFHKKTLLVVNESLVHPETNLPNVSVIVKSESELLELMRNRDAEIMQLLKKGIVLSGENTIVLLIKNSISRF